MLVQQLPQLAWRQSGSQLLILGEAAVSSSLRFRLSWLALFLVLPFVPTPASAADFDEAKLALIKPRLQKFVDEQQVAGIVAVVGSSKGIGLLEAVGNLKLDPKESMPKE